MLFTLRSETKESSERTGGKYYGWVELEIQGAQRFSQKDTSGSVELGCVSYPPLSK